jgi:signal transduction histidine kinase
VSSSGSLPRPSPYSIPPEEFEPELWEEIKRFLEFTPEDAARLVAAREEFGPDIARIVDRFYDHLLSFPATRDLLQVADVGGRLKAQQQQYLESLSGGRYGPEYLVNRLQIGLVHERIGLAPRWYIGAYWLYFRELLPSVSPGAPPAEQAALKSLVKVFLLDMILVMESYIGRTLAIVREQNERLEQIVLERTRQLTKWERLAAVGSMAAKVAHEIRNPLSSITLNTELLNDEITAYRGADTGEAIDLLRAIGGELDRLSRLVEEYLQFARMPRLDLESVDLRDFIRQIVKFLSPELARQEIRTEVEVPESPLVVDIDPNQFRQAILNLLRNSQEAMPAGGRLLVQVREREDRGVEITIVDTGVGIAPADLEKVFDPFYSTKDTGTGLGRAFVQQVAQEHGAEVHCTSQSERGAAFRITLPERMRSRPPGRPAAG